jgi:biopolymer transport protein TolR
MARTFRRARTSHPISDLNVTNLIDLAFTLLIVFMIATSLSHSEQTIPVNLPSQTKTVQPKPDSKTKYLVVGVKPSGEFFMDEGSASVSIAQIHERLQREGRLPLEDQPVVRVRADKTVPYEKVIQIMDEVTQANLTKFSFDTQPK